MRHDPVTSPDFTSRRYVMTTTTQVTLDPVFVARMQSQGRTRELRVAELCRDFVAGRKAGFIMDDNINGRACVTHPDTGGWWYLGNSEAGWCNAYHGWIPPSPMTSYTTDEIQFRRDGTVVIGQLSFHGESLCSYCGHPCPNDYLTACMSCGAM